jgi:hypothetical protein
MKKATPIDQQKLFAIPQTAITSDDYYTPPQLFTTLDLQFDLDVCAPPGGVPWIPATRYLTQQDDALQTQWQGRVFKNPPFSNPAPFVSKFVRHNNGVALVPGSSGKWFHDLWQTELKFVALGYLRFVDGKTNLTMNNTI